MEKFSGKEICPVGQRSCFAFLPVKGETPKCSEILGWKYRRVWPTYKAPHWHVNLKTTGDLRSFGIRFLSRIFATSNTDTNNTDVDTTENNMHFSMLFTGKHAVQVPTQLTKLCSSAFPHLSLHFMFRSGCRPSDFFPFKELGCHSSSPPMIG